MNDLISRQAAIDACRKNFVNKVFVADAVYNQGVENCLKRIKELPSAQPTLYGYDIKHLELIAYVLRKENLPPERITEVLMDVGRIVAMVRDEFEETLRKAVER